jgi:anti-sigma factor RsiW
MKTCPSRLQLESAVLGEVHESRVHELEDHAERCARCRHELNWLRAETAMFAQRTAREEVNRLWEGVDAASARRARRPFRMVRAMLAIAASVLLAFAVNGTLSSRQASSRHHGLEPVPMSLEMMSVEQAELLSKPCYTPGFGIACGEVQLASR